MLPLRNMLQEEWIISLLCAPSIFQIAISMLSAPGLFACILSRNGTAPFMFYLSQACWRLQPLALSSASRRMNEIWPFSFFNGFVEIFFLCVSLCVPFSLILLHDHDSPPSAAHITLLSPKLCLHFLPSSVCTLLSLWLWGLVCQSLGQFPGYLGWFDSYLVVFVGQDEAYHHISTFYLCILFILLSKAILH